jgi:hypothetical protein
MCSQAFLAGLYGAYRPATEHIGRFALLRAKRATKFYACVALFFSGQPLQFIKQIKRLPWRERVKVYAFQLFAQAVDFRLCRI